MGSKDRLTELQFSEENFKTPPTPLGALKLSSEVSSTPRMAAPSAKKNKQAKKIARQLGPSYEQHILPQGQKRVPAVLHGKGKSSRGKFWDQME